MTQAFFGGVGARDTPTDILELMYALSHIYTHKFGLILRSGGAEGADQAFSDGAQGRAVIYCPWPGFKTGSSGLMRSLGPEQGWLFEMAEKYHPNWGVCTRGARALLARNGAIALGDDATNITPSAFVIGWTDGGRTQGGTGQMIRLCTGLNIPFINLGDSSQREQAKNFIHRHADVYHLGHGSIQLVLKEDKANGEDQSVTGEGAA